MRTLVFCRRNQIRLYDIADRTVIPIAIALGLGRIVNFINAEMSGTPYDGPFCVEYSANALEDAIRYHLDATSHSATCSTSLLPADLQGAPGPMAPVMGDWIRFCVRPCS